MPQCKFCGEEIFWSQEGGKKSPLNLDGGAHKCEAYQKSRRSYREIDPQTLDKDIIAQYERSINQKTPKKS